MVKENKTQELEEDPGGRRNKVTLRVFNMSEDVWPFIREMGNKQSRDTEIDENAGLADRDLFTEARKNDRYIFIAPKPIDSDFLSYYRKLFKTTNLEVWVPKTHSGVISKDIISDRVLWKKIVKLGRQTNKLTVTAYTTSPYFLKLLTKLALAGVNISTPSAPREKDAWTVNFFGSKSGIRQLAQMSGSKEPDLVMPDGLVCAGIFDAAKIAANKYLREGGVVIKTNKGHAGAGVLIYRKGDLPDSYSRCEIKIRSDLKLDGYWSRFPIVVESLIEPNYKIGGGFPNTEFLIKPNGEVELLYYCGMRVDEKGVFKGVEISDDAMPKKVATRIIDTGFFIGEEYAKRGYRGYFDVDFIASKKGEIYTNESNVRFTGGTHVYKAARELVGKKFMNKVCVLSHNSYEIRRRKIYSFDELLSKISPYLFDKKSKEGVVVASASLLAQRKLAYIVFGKNRKRAEKIEGFMENAINS